MEFQLIILLLVNTQEGIMRTLESFSELAKDSGSSRQRDFTTPSKADQLLGGGVGQISCFIQNILFLWTYAKPKDT